MSISRFGQWISLLLAFGLTGCRQDPSGLLLYSVESTPQPQAARVRLNPIDGAEMVYIPKGEFVMGTNPDEIDRIWARFHWNEEWKQNTKNEQPSHRVRIDGFWMYRNLVTVAQYRKFCDASRRAMPSPPTWGWIDNHPIVNVSWEDAKAYCAWTGTRLPYEAEWEFAARGGNTGIGERKRTVFVWGDQYPKSRAANLAEESFKKSRYYHPGFYLFPDYDDGFIYTSPVNAYPANGFGLHDMAGNVWQWCEDWSDYEYYHRSPAANPHGPDRGQLRILRGGAFDTAPVMTRIARRISNRPDTRHDEKGFRCVQVE